MPEIVSFFIPGIPKPGGSKRAFVNPKTGRAIVTEDCKTSKDWRGDVKVFARQAFSGPPVARDVALEITVEFRAQRPANHYGSGKNSGVVKQSAPFRPIVKPDATKLLRSLEDALTGIIWTDDAQITDQHVRKRYDDQPGAYVKVEIA